MKNTVANTTPTPQAQPLRERLHAKIALAKGKLEIYKLELDAGERKEIDLEMQRQRIADLETEMKSLDTTIAHRQRMDARRLEELPVLEPELRKRAEDAARKLVAAQDAIKAIVEIHTCILDLADERFPGAGIVHGLTNRQLVAECGSGGTASMIREALEPQGLVNSWLTRLRAAGIEA